MASDVILIGLALAIMLAPLVLRVLFGDGRDEPVLADEPAVDEAIRRILEAASGSAEPPRPRSAPESGPADLPAQEH